MTIALNPTSGLRPAGAVDANNPWPGLESFREQDARWFRGRDAEADDLLRLVLRERLTVLYGLSGLGKSSLLQAGLFPRAREHLLLPVYVRLRHDEEAPDLREQVLDRVAAEATALGIEAPVTNPADTLWEHFHRRDNAYWSADNRPLVPLLVFDQFEEVFTLGASPSRQRYTAGFLEELGDLIEGRPSEALKARLDEGTVDRGAYFFDRYAYKVALTIRQDFLAALERLKRRIPSVMSNRKEIAPLHGDAALLVTAAGGERLVPPPVPGRGAGVGELIVRLVAGDAGADATTALKDLVIDPALLSLFCRELNERRKDAQQESITPDLIDGSREKILSDFYERTTGEVDAVARCFIEDRLIIDDGPRTYRNSEARASALAAGVTESAIRALVGGRLLRVVESEGQLPRLELTHDVLTSVVRQARDRRLAAEEAEAGARRDRERAEELQRQAEARAREEEARRAQLEREAANARRFNRVVAASALLLLGVAVWAGIETAKAKRALKETEKARAAATANANTARLRQSEAEAARQRALALEHRADSTAGALQLTVDAMNAARDSVRLREREAIVGAEVADQYLRMSGKLVTHRVAEDAAMTATVRSEIQKADSIRTVVDSLRVADRRQLTDSLGQLLERSDRELGIVRSVLCEPARDAGSHDVVGSRRTTLEVVEQRLRDSRLVQGEWCAGPAEQRGAKGKPGSP